MRHVTAVLAIAATSALLAGCGASQTSSSESMSALRVAALERVARRDAPPEQASAAVRYGRLAPSCASDMEPARLLSAPEDDTAASQTRSEAGSAETDRWWQKPLAGRSFGEVVKDDIKLFPRELWKSTKDSTNVTNLVLLGAAGGLSAISRGSWDHRVDRSFMEHHGSPFEKTGDFGSVAGSPLLHFGFALGAYGLSIPTENDDLYGFSKSLTQALTLTGLTTVGLKLAAHDYSPNGERWAWPSGHTSSTATVAAVAWEHYGWKAGVPLYLLTGFVAASRLEDREHWLSDVIFGAVLGSVVGHSVARGRMIEVGGFTVLPYVAPQGGAGLAFVRNF